MKRLILLAVGCLFAVTAAWAQVVPCVFSDSLTVYAPTGGVYAQVGVCEANEDPNAIYTLAGVPVDTSKFGFATTLVEPDGTYSDIFGVVNSGNGAVFAFSSDIEGIPTPYGSQGFYFLPEGNGIFDATMYLDPEFQRLGYTAQFISDGDVPEPATLSLLGGGLLALAFALCRRHSA